MSFFNFRKIKNKFGMKELCLNHKEIKIKTKENVGIRRHYTSMSNSKVEMGKSEVRMAILRKGRTR